MWMTVRECLDKAGSFDDTHQLAEKLRLMADEAEPQDRYYLLEAVQNMLGLHDLMRSMAGRLQQGAAGPATSSVEPETARVPRSKLLDVPEVLGVTGIGRTAWLDAVREGRAPAPVRIGKRTFWLASDIESWIRERVKQSRPS
jgi:prophage regulatory protein